MYQKPTIQRFGSFRDLTRIGCGTDGDGVVIGHLDIDGTFSQCGNDGGS